MEKKKRLELTRIVFACALAACLFSPSQDALAHATPVSYYPPASSVLEKLPERIEINFSERVEPKASGIAVWRPDGSRIEHLRIFVNSENPRIFTAELSPEQSVEEEGGTYMVSWQVVSADDGHFTKGAFSFSVGTSSANAFFPQSQFEIRHSSSLPEGSAIFLELLGYALLAGALALYALFWRPAKNEFIGSLSYETQESAKTRISALVLTGVAFVALGSILYIFFKTGETQFVRETGYFESLRVFSGTVAGSFTWYRMFLAMAFGALFFLFRKKILESKRFTKEEAALLAIVLLLGFTRARVSHAAASHFLPSLSVFINFAHLVFKSFFAGGILALGTFLPVMARAGNARLEAFIFTAFGKTASLLLGLAGASGAYIVWLHLKDPSRALDSDWGKIFIMLSLAGGILGALRLYHQLIVDPLRIKALVADKDPTAKRIFARFSNTFFLERFSAVFVLLATAFIIITTPPAFFPQPIQFRAASQEEEVVLSGHPYHRGQILVTVTDPGTESVHVTLFNEERGIGPIVAEIEKIFPGGFMFPAHSFQSHGTWKTHITASRPGKYDAVAGFSINYPRDVEFTSAAESRSLDFFALASILGAAVILMLSFFLYRHAGTLHGASLASVREVSAQESFVFSKDEAISVGAVVFILLFFWLLHGQILRSDFQKLCEKNGHFWNETVPMKEGVALSPIAVPGCSTGIGQGQFHFADGREYKYFLRPAETHVRLETIPSDPSSGEEILLGFVITDPDGKPVEDLTMEHERLLHAIIISEDFSHFSHVHPAKEGDRFTLAYNFPKAGRYLVSVDFAVRGQPFSRQFLLAVEDPAGMHSPSADFSSHKKFGPYEISLKTPAKIKAGKLTRFQYFVEMEGEPVKNIEPYLGAAMHIAATRFDLARFSHTHGEIPPTLVNRFSQKRNRHTHTMLPRAFGPRIDAYVIFPNPGIYRIFGEFRHEGIVTVTYFDIEVVE